MTRREPTLEEIVEKARQQTDLLKRINASMDQFVETVAQIRELDAQRTIAEEYKTVVLPEILAKINSITAEFMLQKQGLLAHYIMIEQQISEQWAGVCQREKARLAAEEAERTRLANIEDAEKAEALRMRRLLEKHAA